MGDCCSSSQENQKPKSSCNNLANAYASQFKSNNRWGSLPKKDLNAQDGNTDEMLTFDTNYEEKTLTTGNSDTTNLSEQNKQPTTE